MILGALVDAGLPLPKLEQGLKAIRAGSFRLRASKVDRSGIRASRVEVEIREGFGTPLTLSRIRKLLTNSRLPEPVRMRSLSVFERLAGAEGIAHGSTPARVRFHELGVVDSLVDVVGAVLGCYLLGVDQVTAAPINVGSGWIECQHGTLPVPGPAVAELTKEIPIYAAGPSRELATPTGVAVLAVLAQEFRPLPVMTRHTVGYGAGEANPVHWPNVLRVFVGERPAHEALVGQEETVVQVETTLDDLLPQVYDAVMERLFGAGALDVVLIPVIMKRSRPGIVVTALAPREHVESVTKVLFQETGTLGVRIQEVRRRVLARREAWVRLPSGMVRMKVAEGETGMTRAMPEYQDCKRIADKTGRPVREILEEAIRAYGRGRGDGS